MSKRIVSRVVRDSERGTELIVKADPYATIRETLEDDWPFKKKKSSRWYLLDERGNDVTDRPISDWDGIAVIYFEE
ncbi:MAG: hypothetical protein ACFFF9_17210 [Candidatus Thorarchaeota archaeon]